MHSNTRGVHELHELRAGWCSNGAAVHIVRLRVLPESEHVRLSLVAMESSRTPSDCCRAFWNCTTRIVFRASTTQAAACAATGIIIPGEDEVGRIRTVPTAGAHGPSAWGTDSILVAIAIPTPTFRRMRDSLVSTPPIKTRLRRSRCSLRARIIRRTRRVWACDSLPGLCAMCEAQCTARRQGKNAVIRLGWRVECTCTDVTW